MVDISKTAPMLSRRRMLTVLGVGSAAIAAPSGAIFDTGSAHAATKLATAATACGTDTDEQEVGPFYVAEGLVRSDITSGEDGVPLGVTMTINDSDTCAPLVGAAVEVWHANALGVYSDESSESTIGETFLRGIQVTDFAGVVTFASIYPGWYSGRTNHIHLRIYSGGSTSGTTYDYTNATLVWTGQLFFDPNLNTKIAAIAPYSSNSVARTTNATDRVYTEQHGSEVLATTTGNAADGYEASCTYTIAGGGADDSDATHLTLVASAASITHGDPITLSGRLRDATSSSGLSGRTVTIHAKTPNGKTVRTTAKTRSGGHWSLTFTPTDTASYRATFAAVTGHAKAASASVAVPVHFRVAVTQVSNSAPAAHPITVSGTIRPAAHGRHVVLHKIVAGKRYPIARTTTTAHGRWTATWHMSSGKHHVVATVPASAQDAAGTSRVITVRRT